MHDSNGKAIHIGDDVCGFSFDGLAKIIGVQEEHNNDEGGAAIIVLPKGAKESISLRTHTAKVVRVPTWKEMASDALAVQDASNLSGVVISFANVIRQVRARLENENKGGSDNVHNHPICRLYADKIASLTNTQTMGNDEVQLAYKWAFDTKAGP